MRQLVLWFGDGLVRLERRPRLYLSGTFVVLWAGLTFVAHFAHLWAGGDRIRHLPWGSAVGAGFGIAAVFTAFAYVVFRRRS